MTDRANSNGPAPSASRPGAGPPSVTTFEALCTWENLLTASAKAAKGKRGRGDVAAWEHRLEDNILGLQASLRAGDYRPGPYASFAIHEPKRRLISAAPFRDRVVHHALCNVIEPAFERGFVADSYANRIGKGTHRALDAVQRLARRHTYVLQGDVRQFFPSIDHAVLRDALARKIGDAHVLRLIDVILAGGQHVTGGEYEMVYFPGDDLLAAARARGLPIGNLTSQFWANVYLSTFDHFVKRELRVAGYVRYVDDFVLFADDAARLWRCRQAIVDRLTELRLTIHPGAHVRPVAEGIPFLGFVVFTHRRRLKRRKAIHFARCLRGLAKAVEAGEVPVARLSASVLGWVNHARHGNTVGLRKAVLRRALATPSFV
jgi:retron-type reverse transcriptase